MKRAGALIIACTLAGCGGGASHGGALPNTPAFKQDVNVGFTMHWPAASTAVSTKRGRKFISPSTASVIVEVNGDTSRTTFANAPAGGGTSTVNINAPAGQDTFVISLYDQPQSAGETAPVGNELGQASLSQSIDAGKTNVVNATISGMVTRVAVAAAANQPFVESLPDGGFALVGDSPQVFTATALDADGNVIVPSPAVSITVPTYDNNPPIGTTFFTVNSVPNTSNEFAINASTADEVGLFSVNTTLTASAKDSLGNTAATTYTLKQSPAMYVSYATSASGAAPLLVLDGSGNSVPLAAGAFSGLQNPAGLAYDPVDHRLFVADSGLQQLLAFNADGSPVAGFPYTRVTGANSVAYDPNNHLLYVTGSNEVVTLTTDGQSVSSSGQFGFTSHPSSVAYVAGPYILVGSADSGNVDVYDESGVWIQSFADPYSAVRGMASDPKYNDVFVAGPATGRSGISVTRSYADGSVPRGVAVADPHGMAYDQIDDELYVVSGSANALVPVTAYPDFGPVNSAGTLATPVSSGLSQPSGLAITY